jgi:hypothetical protein
VPAHADSLPEAPEREEATESVKLGNAAAMFSDEMGLRSNMDPAVGDATTRHEPLASIFADGATPSNFEGIKFQEMAPFLRAADSSQDRRRMSREFDARITAFLRLGDDPALPRIQCFYGVLSHDARHNSLIAATTSMRAMGHPVNVWSYTPEKLEFLRPHGIELRAADEVLPKSLFDQIVACSEIRYFSDLFRYAALYEHGGLWMDTNVVLLRPFPFQGDYFFNLQWRPGNGQRYFICGNVIYAKPYSLHFRTLYEIALDRFFGSPHRVVGSVGPELLSEYIASAAGAELRSWVFSPMFFNSIDWTEIDRFKQTLSRLADYLNDDRVFGIHLWALRNDLTARNDSGSLIALLSNPLTGFPNLIISCRLLQHR